MRGEVTTDQVYRYFQQEERPLKVKDVALKFRITHEQANRLMRKMVEKESRLILRQHATCEFDYVMAEVTPRRDFFVGWGSAPRLGMA